VNSYQREYPAAVACFRDEFEALLPSIGSRSGTASGSAPRTWPNAPSSINAADRWCRVSISDLERHQFRPLPAELGLDPLTRHRPPRETDDQHPAQERRRMITQATRSQEPQELTIRPWGLTRS
jgi:hypothetical protein